MEIKNRRKLLFQTKRQTLCVLFRMRLLIGELKTVASLRRSVHPIATDKRLYSRLHGTPHNECQRSRSHVTDVPKGSLAVYVGEDTKRFVISVQVLNHPSFAKLLQMSAEKYGYEQKGGLKIPCDVMLFQQIIYPLCNNDECLHADNESMSF